MPKLSLQTAPCAAAVVLFLLSTPAGHARAAFDDAGTDAGLKREARDLYQSGLERYRARDYEGAVFLFQKGYNLSREPDFLFDIAQAYRLAGHCQLALEKYRQFLQLNPTSFHRGDVERRIATLTDACPPETPTIATTVAPPPPIAPGSAATLALPSSSLAARPVSQPSLLTAVTPRAPASPPFLTRTTVKWTTAAVGAALGLGAGGLYLWNNGRYDQWQNEDRRLSGLNPPAADPAAIAPQQDANDNRLRSIQRVDRVVAVSAAVAALCLIGSALLAILPDTPLSAQASAGTAVDDRMALRPVLRP